MSNLSDFNREQLKELSKKDTQEVRVEIANIVSELVHQFSFDKGLRPNSLIINKDLYILFYNSVILMGGRLGNTKEERDSILGLEIYLTDEFIIRVGLL